MLVGGHVVAIWTQIVLEGDCVTSSDIVLKSTLLRQECWTYYLSQPGYRDVDECY